MKKYYFIFIILLSLTVSCSEETDDKTYSLALLESDYDNPFEPPKYAGYNSKAVCSQYFDLTENRLILYKNSDGVKRTVDTLYIPTKMSNDLKSIVRNLASKTNEGYSMDSTIYCGIRCRFGTIVIPVISNKYGIKETYTFTSISMDEKYELIKTLHSLKMKNSLMSKHDFLPNVLFAEQYANLQFALPPPPPKYMGKKVKFTPPKISN